MHFVSTNQMEWQIKTLARKSALTGEPFNPGDRIVCVIFKDLDVGEVGRVDLLVEEVAQFELPGQVLGRWTREVKHPDEDASHAQDRMASAEDFFLSLYEADTVSEDATVNGLKHVLALMLERKRVIRAVGKRQLSGEQVYLHVKQKNEIVVPIVDISIELMQLMEDTLGDIIH